MSHTCLSCGAISDEPHQLCNPDNYKLSCQYCGKEDVSVNHVCKERLAAMHYSCGSCGKVSDSEDGLCEPQKIG